MDDDLAVDLDRIADPVLRRLIGQLLNRIEDVQAEVAALREENQRLRDENARLRGLPSRPTFPTRSPFRLPTDHSSESARHTPTPRQRRRRDHLIIHRRETLDVDPGRLPPDAQCKGYVEVTVQDVVLRADNVVFRRAKWYSPTTHQTYVAPLPPGYHGQVGPGLRALVLALAYGSHVSQPKIAEFLRDLGIDLSAGQVANLLVQEQDVFHTEARAVGDAGLRSSPWQHLDDTATPVGRQHQHCHVIGNPLYTRYQTTPRKDRLAVRDVLRNGAPRTFLLDAAAVAVLGALPLATATRRGVARLPRDQILDEATLGSLLAAHVPRLSQGERTRVLETLALAADRATMDDRTVQTLVCDDAPQFAGVTAAIQLCWVHAGRHYHKLDPWVPVHRRILGRFRARFWRYYRKLLVYRDAPSPAAATRLRRAFDRLFATTTGYQALDRRIAATRAHKAALLQVLAHPELPLHNNPAELGARRRVRKRKVSYGPQSAAGARAWDTFQTLAATAAKLDVSFYQYLCDRLSGTPHLPALADLIAERASTLNLGASWMAQTPTPDY
jgi:regulator of replication initiation timing